MSDLTTSDLLRDIGILITRRFRLRLGGIRVEEAVKEGCDTVRSLALRLIFTAHEILTRSCGYTSSKCTNDFIE